jgi:hypothetical protein
VSTGDAALIVSGLSLALAGLSYRRAGKREEREARLQDPVVVVKMEGLHDDPQILTYREVVVSVKNIGPGTIRDVGFGARWGDWEAGTGKHHPALAPGESDLATVPLPLEVEQQLLAVQWPDGRVRAPLAVEGYVTAWARYTDVHGQAHEVRGTQPPMSKRGPVP